MSSNGFELSHEFSVNGVKVSKFKSLLTGLRVVIADIEGPLVEGAFALATEAHDDDGCPHTLEHLIFLGSELYPYKGILDGLANRCLAQGTNAWTDVDHTAYTLTTAGSEGFLNLLPVYLDHILYPILTDSGFHTEVHHINGDGENAGVVYCEMQGRENASISLLYRGLLQSIWPGDCGFKYETGGIMENLRNLHVDKVRQYHKDFYRPDNLCLIISGKVNPKEVFDVLRPFEARVASKGQLLPLTKPWSTPILPLTESETKVVTFPSDDEATGSVMIGWRGPKYTEYELITAIKTAWKYLTDSSVSPLYQVFVEIEQPICTDIHTGTIENSELCAYTRFENVPTALLGGVKSLLLDTISEICKKGIDQQRMKDIIQKSILEHNNSMEENPHRVVQFASIGHFLYGSQDSQLEQAFNEISRLEQLKLKDSKFWVDIMNEYIIGKPHICVEGQPSIKRGEDLQLQEKARIDDQVQKLGETRLAELKNELEQATKKNELPIPDEIFTSFKIPNVAKIPFIPVVTIRNDEIITPSETASQLLQYWNQGHQEKLPIFVQVDNVNSAFVVLRLILETSFVPDELRSYLQLYMDAFFELPIMRDGKLIPYEEVVAELNRDVLSYQSSLGFKSGKFECGTFSQCVVLELKLEKSNYTKGLKWIRKLGLQSVFSPEKLKVNIAKLLNDIPQRKRKGGSMVGATVRSVNFDEKKSNQATSIITHQQGILTSIAKQLETPETAIKVASDLETLRKLLFVPTNMRLQVVGNLATLPSPKEAILQELLPTEFTTKNYVDNITQIRMAQQFLTDKTNQGFIIGIAAIENAFLAQTVRGPSSFTDEDEAALHVVIEYLTGMESPFWKRIRGLGLAYGYGISMKIEEGLLYFSLAKSSHVVKAYQVSREIIDDLITKKVEIEDVRLESSRSGAVFGIVSREETMDSAGTQAVLNYLKNVSFDYNKQLLTKIQNVGKEDIMRVLVKYIKPLFDTAQTNVAVATNPAKLEEITKGFAEFGHKLTELQSNN